MKKLIILALFILTACENKQTPVKPVHYETVIGNASVVCKKMEIKTYGIKLLDCVADMQGMEFKIPDIMAASNVLKVEEPQK